MTKQQVRPDNYHSLIDMNDFYDLLSIVNYKVRQFVNNNYILSLTQNPSILIQGVIIFNTRDDRRDKKKSFLLNDHMSKTNY